MLCIQRNHAEHAHVLVQDHDLGWRLNDLNRKQADQCESRHTEWEAESCRVVDASLVERLQYARRRLCFVGSWISDDLLRRRVGWRRRIESRASHAEA